MTETEQNILDALLELERTIEAMPRTTPKPNLLPLFARLDELTLTLPRTTDPTLLHYLHKKSYQKARLFLQGCGGSHARPCVSTWRHWPAWFSASQPWRNRRAFW